MKKMPDEMKLPQREINKKLLLAQQILSDEPGVVYESEHDFQCFIYKDNAVTLVFYPHRSSASNYHIRVRDQGSKDKIRASELMKMLDDGAGYNCTFSHKIK